LILAQPGPCLIHGKRIDLDPVTHALTPLPDYRGQYYALPEKRSVHSAISSTTQYESASCRNTCSASRAMKSWPALGKAATQYSRACISSVPQRVL
jgi:hypothetical protein